MRRTVAAAGMVAMAALAAVAIAQEQTPVEVPARPPVDAPELAQLGAIRSGCS